MVGKLEGGMVVSESRKGRQISAPNLEMHLRKDMAKKPTLSNPSPQLQSNGSYPTSASSKRQKAIFSFLPTKKAIPDSHQTKRKKIEVDLSLSLRERPFHM